MSDAKDVPVHLTLGMAQTVLERDQLKAELAAAREALSIFAERDHEMHCEWNDNGLGVCDCAYGKARAALTRIDEFLRGKT